MYGSKITKRTAKEALWLPQHGCTYACPNPFVLSAANQVNFVEVSRGARLILTTVAGDIVRHWINDTGKDIFWDGTNESGNPVSSGTYLWYIEDTDIKGKLIVVR